jgi:hypothetical protein
MLGILRRRFNLTTFSYSEHRYKTYHGRNFSFTVPWSLQFTDRIFKFQLLKTAPNGKNMKIDEVFQNESISCSQKLSNWSINQQHSHFIQMQSPLITPSALLQHFEQFSICSNPIYSHNMITETLFNQSHNCKGASNSLPSLLQVFSQPVWCESDWNRNCIRVCFG